MLNCLQIRIKGLSPSSLYYNICKFPFTTNEPAAYVVFLQMRISAKIKRLLEMFTSTVHNISHRPCTGTWQTYRKISALPSVRYPPRSSSLCIKRGSYSCGFHLQTAYPRPTVQRSQHCLSGWNRLGGLIW